MLLQFGYTQGIIFDFLKEANSLPTIKRIHYLSQLGSFLRAIADFIESELEGVKQA